MVRFFIPYERFHLWIPLAILLSSILESSNRSHPESAGIQIWRSSKLHRFDPKNFCTRYLHLKFEQGLGFKRNLFSSIPNENCKLFRIPVNMANAVSFAYAIFFPCLLFMKYLPFHSICNSLFGFQNFRISACEVNIFDLRSFSNSSNFSFQNSHQTWAFTIPSLG